MNSNLSFCCLLILLCTVMNEAANRKPKRQATPDPTAAPKADAESTEPPVTQPKTLDRGWGSSIEWVQTYEEALAASRETKKPLMVIHHLEDCPFSQDLKKAFVADPLAQKLAQENFVMLNVVHPVADENQSPDGHYVPRVIFVDPSMTVRTDLAGRYSNRLYAYEAGDIPELVTNMKKAKTLLHTEL
ncbi:PREDICTED: anterior gradient protein 2-like [Nanorana parkeri]|uniref:anterior gradient protein 2-like n=1 Tax=Nanorana parkeri TaxID=125878 RepID=UPI000854E699|nr:PREDICTED: anterior gradient protein 2-like [Nanorana parkeri]